MSHIKKLLVVLIIGLSIMSCTVKSIDDERPEHGELEYAIFPGDSNDGGHQCSRDECTECCVD